MELPVRNPSVIPFTLPGMVIWMSFSLSLISYLGMFPSCAWTRLIPLNSTRQVSPVIDQERGPFFVMTTVLSPDPPGAAGDDEAGTVCEGFGVADAEDDGFGVAEGEGAGVAEADGFGVGVAVDEGVPVPDELPFRTRTTDFLSDDGPIVYTGFLVVSTTTLVRRGSERLAIRICTTEPLFTSNFIVWGT